MMQLVCHVLGYAVIEASGIAPERYINRLAEQGISFYDVEKISDFAVRLRVLYRSSQRALQIAAHVQCEANIIYLQPGIRGLVKLAKRPVLAIGVLFAIFASLYFPKFVWTVSVSGNETISNDEILRALDSLGVHFGAKNDTIDSIEIKNRLLNLVDGLQWAAINCSGGRCEVLVKEREEEPVILDRRLAVDVIAAQSGVITELSVLQGESLCSVGDAVEAGDVLVTGMSDQIVNLQTSHAQAEIYALTWRDVCAVMPTQHTVNTELQEHHTSVFLQLGRLRIKICGNSRICGVGCDKMISRKILTMPGGITLPVSVITQTCCHYTQQQQHTNRQEATERLSRYAEDAVIRAMTDGTVLTADSSIRTGHGCYCLDAVYACREMIAREQEVNLFGSEQNYGRKNSERRTD